LRVTQSTRSAPDDLAEAAALITTPPQGHHVWSCASGEGVGPAIATALGCRARRGTRMTVVDGRYTGEIGLLLLTASKAVAGARLAERTATSSPTARLPDSITDLPLLELVGRRARGHPAAPCGRVLGRTVAV